MSDQLTTKSVSDRIIESATILFAVKGYEGVSVKELTQTAGVNSALISYYFGGKKELYSHVLTTQLAILDSIVGEMQPQVLAPAEKIHRFAQQLIAAHDRYPYLIRLVMVEIINPTDCYDSIVKKTIIKINCFLRDCVQQGIEAGAFKAEVDPAVAAIALVGIINFYFMTLPLSQELSKGKEANYNIEQSIHHYLQGISNLC